MTVEKNSAIDFTEKGPQLREKRLASLDDKNRFCVPTEISNSFFTETPTSLQGVVDLDGIRFYHPDDYLKEIQRLQSMESTTENEAKIQIFENEVFAAIVDKSNRIRIPDTVFRDIDMGKKIYVWQNEDHLKICGKELHDEMMLKHYERLASTALAD